MPEKSGRSAGARAEKPSERPRSTKKERSSFPGWKSGLKYKKNASNAKSQPGSQSQPKPKARPLSAKDQCAFLKINLNLSPMLEFPANDTVGELIQDDLLDEPL